MKKKTMKKLVGMLMLCVSCMFAFNGVSANAAMADEAEEYELSETVQCTVNAHDQNVRYFKFNLFEKSHVTANIELSGENLSVYALDSTSFNIYNSFGEIVFNNIDLQYQENTLTGKWHANYSKTLSEGTYYVEIYSRTTASRCYSFFIQSEKQIKLPKGSITSLRSYKKKQVTVKCESADDAIGYMIYYSTDYRFKKNVKSVESAVPTKILKKLKPGKRYYVKVCSFSVYDDGTYVFGQNSKVKSVVIKK